MILFFSKSSNETKRLGHRLGKLLKPGMVVALTGELGAGKTTLVKGIAKGLGVLREAEISSSTFVIIQEYQGREKIFHLDWYRLKKVQDVDAAFAQECFDADAVTLVEWADRGKEILPKERLSIQLSHQDARSRLIEIRANAKRFDDILKMLQALAKRKIR